jgi:hypothetical protein
MSLMIFATAVLFLDGLAYLCLGVCVLFPGVCPNAPWARTLSSFYLAMFKDYTPLQSEDSGEEEGEPDKHERAHPVAAACGHVGWRLAAYLLLLLGLCRVVTSFHWGCGYIMLGLTTCIAEIGFLCNELLRHESARLHRTMGFVLHNVAVSLLYIGSALPHCRG